MYIAILTMYRSEGNEKNVMVSLQGDMSTPTFNYSPYMVI